MTDTIDPTLAGCTMLVTADRRAAELGGALQRRGAVARYAPALSMVPNESDALLIAATRALLEDPPDIAVVTTGIGFRAWIEAADAVGLAELLVAALGRARLVARGPKARGAIQAAGLQADWVAESETSAEIAEVLLDEGVAGRRITVQHHGSGADGLDEAFTAAGAQVQSLVVYRWGPPPDPVALDASVRAAAAVGPITAQPLLDRGIAPLVPARGRLGALVRTVLDHYGGLRTLETVAGRPQVHRRAAVLDGHVLAISPTGIEVLRLLAEANGDVVTPTQVLAALPGESTDAHAAEAAIARLRQAAGSRDIVRTVVKRGYRLAIVDQEPAGAFR